jgi:hypothetical protein
MTNAIHETNGTDSTYLDPAGTTSAKTAQIDLVLPPTEASLDPLAGIEELLLEMRVEDRSTARQENQIEQQRIKTSCDTRVRAIHDEADATELQGWISGGAQIVGGALQAVGGFGPMTLRESKGFEGCGHFFEGVGGIGGAVVGQDIADAQAAQTRAETEQNTAEARADEATTEMQNAREDLRSLLDQIQRINDAELAAQKAAVFLR